MTPPSTSRAPLLAALLCLAAPALAQAPVQPTAPVPAPAPPAVAVPVTPEDKTALVQQLLTLTHARRNADNYLQILLNTEQRTLADFTPKQIADDTGLTPAQRALMLKEVGPIEARAMAQVGCLAGIVP